MTYDEQIQYYADLLIVQYRKQPKAQATIQALAREALLDNIDLAVQDAFDIETAVGAQLDILGKYVNISRDALVASGGVALGDDDYRALIKLCILRNGSNFSLKSIDDFLFSFFQGKLVVFDNSNMTLSYFINGSLGSLVFLEALKNLGFFPRPMGVALSSIVYANGVEGYFRYVSQYGTQPHVGAFTSYYSPDTRNFTGNTTSGSKIITNIADTSVLTAGNPIGGAGIPANSFIDTIDSSSQIHIKPSNATATATGVNLYTQELDPWINFDDVVSL